MGLPVLAIGSDRAWRARIERLLALRGELSWRGTFAPDALRSGGCTAAALWLVDGDDPTMDRACSHIRTAEPIRLHFYRRPDVATLRRCTQIGGSGCLDKQAPLALVMQAIREVGSGLFAVDRSLLLTALGREPPPDAATPPPPDFSAAQWPQLTQRQCEIVHWAAQGLSNKQIGRRLGISPETVKSHLHNVFEREGISGRVALLASHNSGTDRNGTDSSGNASDDRPQWSAAIATLLGLRDDRRLRSDRRGRAALKPR